MTLRVLIVEDEVLVAKNVQAFLEDEGMSVVAVASAEEAVDRIKAGENYDVCVMDLRLPGMDGSTGIRVLHEMCPVLKFVIHTGSVHFAIPEDLKLLGIDQLQLLRKPLQDMGIMAQAIRDAVET